MSRFLVLATVAGLLISLAVGQNAAPAKPKLGPSAALEASWNEIGRKLIAMAEDFPEDKYDFKPTPAQKSFAEQLVGDSSSVGLFPCATSVNKSLEPATWRALQNQG